MKPKILIADDHSIVRTGLRLLCESNGYSNINEASSCREVLNKLNNESFTHLVLDINLADGSAIKIIPDIRNIRPNLRIIILSMQPAEIYGEALKQYGVNDYISKDTQEAETMDLLRHFLQNEELYREETKHRGSNNPFTSLSPREFEVLHYLLKGLKTNEIATRLNLRWNTISTVKTNIFDKTGASNFIELKEMADLYKIV